MSSDTAIVNCAGTLPKAIWLPTSPEPSVYRGQPVEMVQTMAEEMGDISLKDAIDMILTELAFTRDIQIDIEGIDSMSEEDSAHLFVFALLQIGIAKPLPQA